MDGNHIKSTRVFCPAGFLQEELLGGVCQFFALAGIDALEGTAPAGMTPVADFGEYYCIAVEHDQIELAASAQPVLEQQAQSVGFEMIAG